MNDGELFVTGRKDDLLIVNGRNIYAHDIEFSVSRIDGIIPGRAIALGIFNPSPAASASRFWPRCAPTGPTKPG